MKETVYRLDTPVSIALLTDTHNRRPEPILQSLRRHKPEMIAIAGDIVIGRPPERGLLLEQNENALPLLRACASIAPTFFSLGNHEGQVCEKDLALIRSTGVTLLDNSWCAWNGISVGGMTSPKVLFCRRYKAAIRADEPYPRLGDRRVFEDPALLPIWTDRKVPVTAWLSAWEKQPGWKLLLAHEPHLWEPYLRGRNIDLILSGHAHGGQWRFFGRGVWAPDQGLFPNYTSGLHENLIISRGLTNTAAPIPRLFNPTEIVYIAKA